MTHLSVDLHAVNLEPTVPSLPAWLADIDRRMADAAARGVQLVMLPEFACASWLGFAPPDLPPVATLGWLADRGAEALPHLRAIVETHRVSLVPGTIPTRAGTTDPLGAVYNRAYLLSPGGGTLTQDKLSLTPLEAQGDGGATLPGTEIRVGLWNGLRVAFAICLDTEYTQLWSHLGALDLDLVLIPAKTDKLSGYHRVFGCARARAIELQTVVCAVGAIGVPFGTPVSDTGVGGAGVFLPCDAGLRVDGLFALSGPSGADQLADGALFAQDIPVGACRAIRNGHAEAEVAPSQWTAAHLTVSTVDLDGATVRRPGVAN